MQGGCEPHFYALARIRIFHRSSYPGGVCAPFSPADRPTNRLGSFARLRQQGLLGTPFPALPHRATRHDPCLFRARNHTSGRLGHHGGYRVSLAGGALDNAVVSITNPWAPTISTARQVTPSAQGFTPSVAWPSAFGPGWAMSSQGGRPVMLEWLGARRPEEPGERSGGAVPPLRTMLTVMVGWAPLNGDWRRQPGQERRR